jgi:hypothetical protein
MSISSYLKSVHPGLVSSPGSSGYSNGTDERHNSVAVQRKTRSLIVFLFLACLAAHAADRQTAIAVRWSQRAVAFTICDLFSFRHPHLFATER